MKFCPKCGSKVESQWKLCPFCELSLQQVDIQSKEPQSPEFQVKYCIECHIKAKSKWKICPFCGSSLRQVNIQLRKSQSPESQERGKDLCPHCLHPIYGFPIKKGIMLCLNCGEHF